jgi:hypothetical protein
VTLERDTLVMAYNGIRAKLQPWHYETFSALRNPDDPALEDAKITFRTSVAGRIDAAVIALEAATPASVFMRQPDARLRDASYITRFAGRYQIPGGPVVTVSVRGNALYWSQGGGAPSLLTPESGARFVLAAQTSISVDFKLDASGKVTGARVVQPGAVTDLTRIP